MARKKNKKLEVNTHQTRPPQGYGGYGYGPQFIQLPPIIQPVIMMPYGDQPQAPQFVDDDDYYDDDDDF